MAIRLVDVSFEHEEEVEFGTCELCMYTAPYDFSYFHFVDTEFGDEFTVSGFEWSFGDLFEVTIGNVCAFADWLNKKGVEKPDDPDFIGCKISCMIMRKKLLKKNS